jgi:hypothetical protein
VEVLWWLVPAAIATVLAMLWALWAGRRQRAESSAVRRRSAADDDAARARLGLALSKPLPPRATHITHQNVPSATGVAVRRRASRSPAGTDARPAG